jgi:hypothetical protein
VKDKKWHQYDLEVTSGKLVFLAKGNNPLSKNSNPWKMCSPEKEALKWNGTGELIPTYTKLKKLPMVNS